MATSSARLHPDRGQSGAIPLLLVFALFGALASVVYFNNPDPEIRRINLVAQEYANAWRTGSLDSLRYDGLSAPGVGDGDPSKISARVKDIVDGLDGTLDGTSNLHPDSVTVDRDQTRRSGDLASSKLWVTWKLQPEGLEQTAHVWTYSVELKERLSSGRWRVVWLPEAVHPAIRQGLVMRLTRSQPARSVILGAQDTPLPPSDRPTLARGLLGAIASPATAAQAQSDPLRAKVGDTVGVAGLQELYDARLAGGARVEVDAVLDPKNTSNISTIQQPLFVGPPLAPKPLKITLDRRAQASAEDALAGITTPATVVAVRASTGEVLAVANTVPPGTAAPLDYGLSSQQPPGPVFGMASTLALLRSSAISQQTRQKYTLTTTIDCSQPYTVGGQVFRNLQGPSLGGVQLGSAVEGGCVTGLARAAADVTPKALRTAAFDLGLATPRDATDGAPGYFALADQLGTPAFHGVVPPTSDASDTDAVRHAENMVGEGQVLVSPLSMARAAATVSSGTRRAVRLIVDPAPTHADQPKNLPADELDALRLLLSKGVTEPGGSAHALASLGDVHALAGTAGYGTGQGQKRQAWCVGYLGDTAFAVLIPDTTSGNAAQAVSVASKFLNTTR